MAKNRIYIPTFISSINYNPVRVLPHIYFYNGLKSCEPYYIQGYANGNTGSVVSNEQEFFPYFDNYEGNNPQSGSRSLLFFNEPSFYGTTPTGSLYTEYWSKYIDLLYNPRTRLFECSAIIPLADYFKMELNDIVEWRGNYYHLRAINNYNLKNGECDLQLLGPILGDILPDILPAIACGFDFSASCISQPPPTTTTLAPTCTCYSYVATGSIGGGVVFTNCGNFSSSRAIAPGESGSICVQFGTTPIVADGDILLFSCGNNQCFEVADCLPPCLPTTTTTTTLSPTTTTLAPTTTTTLAPTTTTTIGLTSFDNCGYGDTVGNACTDAIINARTLYSNCDALSFGTGCVVYADNIGPSPLTGNSYVFINGAVWDINPANGVIIGISSIQC
jgi:hypothetical protein